MWEKKKNQTSGKSWNEIPTVWMDCRDGRLMGEVGGMGLGCVGRCGGGVVGNCVVCCGICGRKKKNQTSGKSWNEIPTVWMDCRDGRLMGEMGGMGLECVGRCGGGVVDKCVVCASKCWKKVMQKMIERS